MKKFYKYLILLTLISNSYAYAEQALIGVVNGMVCMECQNKVSQALTEKAGVKAAITVAWPEDIAVVSFEKKTNLSEQDFKDAVESAGFTTGKIVKVDEYVKNAQDGLLILKKF